MILQRRHRPELDVFARRQSVAATLDVWNVIAVVALVAAVQFFEVFVVRRRVDGVTLYLGPALPLIVALIGWDLYGLGGAIWGVLLLVLALAITDAVKAEQDTDDPANITTP